MENPNTRSTSSEELPLLSAIVVGATGETGRILVRYLVQNERYNKVTMINRTPKTADFFRLNEALFDQKTQQIELPDFDNMRDLDDALFENHQAAFSALGTTTNLSDKEQYRKIEFYAYDFAEKCREVDVPRFYNITTTGSNSSSWTAYTKLKGQVEDAISALNFATYSPMRPSLILGIQRSTRVFWESPIAKFVSFLNPILPKYMQELHLTRIAQSMVRVSIDDFDNDVDVGFRPLSVTDIKELTPEMSNFPEGWNKYDGEK
eukprot:TRINITY_DN234_c0_g1_i1.p1 TRINITY_DN234_c0_g1~~TRINITY_DN234_c0_g1_i1.p1  ORF type:complete len:263 (-),score=52.77 TRINITY_DN234_c0_g1_i1:40-828(-)